MVRTRMSIGDRVQVFGNDASYTFTDKSTSLVVVNIILRSLPFTGFGYIIKSDTSLNFSRKCQIKFYIANIHIL